MTSTDNPADSASRGLNTVKEAKVRQWFEGPAFPKLIKNPLEIQGEVERETEWLC